MPRLPKPDPQRSNSAPWTAVSEDAGRAVPHPPASLTVAERRVWRALWRSAPGQTWDPVADLDPVTRLMVLRRLVAGGDWSLHGQLVGLEDRLGLSPKARRAMSMTTAAAPVAAPRSVPSGRPDPRLRSLG